MITQEELKSLLDYDEITGLFTWKVRVARNVKIGQVAGTIVGVGHRQIKLSTVRYYAHRLAWLFVYGSLPVKYVDHIDGNSDNNAISNLREATQSQNLFNQGMHRNNTTGFKGVYKDKRSGTYRATAQNKGLSVNLGTFKTPEAAYEKVVKFSKRFHGEFAHSSLRTSTSI